MKTLLEMHADARSVVTETILKHARKYRHFENEILDLISEHLLWDPGKAAPVRVVIPAAGNGTRLGAPGPKSLCRVGGRPILHRLLEAVMPFDPCPIIIVNSESGGVIAEAVSQAGLRAEYVVQKEQLGMGHAVLQTESALCSHDGAVLILWGDMPVVRYETLATIVRVYEVLNPRITAVFPTVWRRDPYVAMVRDGAGRLTDILRARQGDPMPAQGENDCGVFLVQKKALFEGLRILFQTWEAHLGRTLTAASHDAAQTDEFELLPLFPWLEGEGHRVLLLNLASTAESRSLNTPADMDFAEAYYGRAS